MANGSTTGDIVWRWQEGQPKTVELYNVNPEPPEPEPVPAQQPAVDPQQREAMRAMMVAQGEQRGFQLPSHQYPLGQNMTPEEKRAARKQVRTFLQSMRDPSGKYDLSQGIQELVDSGAVVYDEDGLWTALPLRNKRDQQRLIGAADAWADQVGLWKTRPEGGGADFVPERYKPYGSPEQRDWAERRSQWREEAQQIQQEALKYPEQQAANEAAGRMMGITAEEIRRLSGQGLSSEEIYARSIGR